jgi:SAM-dependent methyltransferase
VRGGFDRDYFRRFYEAEETRVRGPDELGHLLTAITEYLAWMRAPLASVLDAGAGPGQLRDWFHAHRPEVRVRSVDASAEACAAYGHEQHDLARWRDPDARFDLVFCMDVFNYLDDAECATAVENLAAMSGGFLYFHVMAQEDMLQADPRSDFGGHWRPSGFYKNLLQAQFLPLGLGLWARRGLPLVLWSMER